MDALCDVEVFLLCGWGPPFPLCDVNVWLLGPGSQGGQQESGIFKLHQLSVFAGHRAVFGQEILPFDDGRNKASTTCELTQLKMFWAKMWAIYTEKGAPTQMHLIFLG